MSNRIHHRPLLKHSMLMVKFSKMVCLMYRLRLYIRERVKWDLFFYFFVLCVRNFQSENVTAESSSPTSLIHKGSHFSSWQTACLRKISGKKTTLQPYTFSFFSPAVRFSPSKRTRNSIAALKSSSQEILSSQNDDKNDERLGASRSLASLEGQGS